MKKHFALGIAMIMSLATLRCAVLQDPPDPRAVSAVESPTQRIQAWANITDPTRGRIRVRNQSDAVVVVDYLACTTETGESCVVLREGFRVLPRRTRSSARNVPSPNFWGYFKVRVTPQSPAR